MANLLDGKLVSTALKASLQEEMNHVQGKKPKLVAVLVGAEAASSFYVESKMKSCAEVGIDSEILRLDSNVTQDKLLEEVNTLNIDNNVTGYIVQLPLPKHIDEQKIISSINPEKDVDGFHPYNVGKLALNQKSIIPATPLGILKLLEYYKIKTEGKHVVIIGRSHIVGSPMALLLQQNRTLGNATVTICHSKTIDLKKHCKQADILIAAIGKPNFVTEDFIKENAIVIDVGINSINDASKPKGYKIVGDVDFENVKNKCSWISPVPGGVGLMTVAALISNTIEVWKEKNKL